jgi:hypothetical protein
VHDAWAVLERRGSARRHNTPFPQRHATPSILAAMVRGGPVGMHAWCRVTQWSEWTVLRAVEHVSQRAQACGVLFFFLEDLVVILDLETSEQKMIKVKGPWKCATSHQSVAVVTAGDGLHLFMHDGELLLIIPDSNGASCATFHPLNPSIIAIGFFDGSVRTRDVRAQAFASSFKEHTNSITNIRFS